MKILIDIKTWQDEGTRWHERYWKTVCNKHWATDGTLVTEQWRRSSADGDDIVVVVTDYDDDDGEDDDDDDDDNEVHGIIE